MIFYNHVQTLPQKTSPIPYQRANHRGCIGSILQQQRHTGIFRLLLEAE